MLILVMVVFLVFLVLGMPIAFCMALSAGAAIVLNPSLPVPGGVPRRLGG